MIKLHQRPFLNPAHITPFLRDLPLRPFIPAALQSEAANHDSLLAVIGNIQILVDLRLLDLKLHLIDNIFVLRIEDIDQRKVNVISKLAYLKNLSEGHPKNEIYSILQKFIGKIYGNMYFRLRAKLR
jgi:hypothetical protein